MAKGDETRSAILAAGISLASEIGLDGVSIGALADRVGMSKSGLFAHFSSKENLQVAILREASSRFVDLVVAPSLRERRGEPRVRSLFAKWLAWSSRVDFMPGGCIFVAASVELDDKPGPARDALVASQKDWLEVVATAARLAVEEKHFREDLDPRQFAYEMFSIAYGYHFMNRLIVDPKAEKRVHLAFERLMADAAGHSRPNRVARVTSTDRSKGREP
ncbi:MAG: TetR/AcrR family transcriptional regulator [Polyangiaceae bacterium]